MEMRIFVTCISIINLVLSMSLNEGENNLNEYYAKVSMDRELDF